MAKRTTKGCLLAAGIWIVILAALAAATKYLILPYFRKDLEEATGTPVRYRHEIVLAADSFSGYCVLRSAAMRNELKAQGIKLTVRDDQADYAARTQALGDGRVQMAVFTVDSFLLTGSRRGEFPGTIVAVIDETKGADAIVAYKSAVGSLADLDHTDARMVLTPQSPSEFLARVVKAYFRLPNLPDRWWEEADGAVDVYRKFKAADKKARRAYVLWEPYVSMALEVPDAHLLLDSAKLEGLIVDVLVAERRFLRDQPALVEAVIKAYFRALYTHSQKPNDMRSLIMEDARETGAERLTGAQADKLAAGIAWKNTVENYAHFALQGTATPGGPQPIEDILTKVAGILVKTGALADDPIGGRVNTLYYSRTLESLKTANFHPGEVIPGVQLGSAVKQEPVRTPRPPGPRTPEEWERMIPVVEIEVEPISFARGTASLAIQGQRNLDGLAGKLADLPLYYLAVVGHARAEGDPAANQRLARERADAALQYLLSKGIDPNRLQARTAPPSGRGGEAQSVSFVLLQEPY